MPAYARDQRRTRPAWLPAPTARHHRAAARAPASRRRRPHRSAASWRRRPGRGACAELMEQFNIDARRIRAEGRPTPAPRPPRSPARASCGSMPRPGPSRRALHLRHQRQRQAVLDSSTTADRPDFQPAQPLPMAQNDALCAKAGCKSILTRTMQ